MTRPLSPAVRRSLEGAADRILYSRGLHDATLDEICADAMVGKPALYRHFGSRDELVADYLTRRCAQRRQAIAAAIASAPRPARDRVLAIIDWIAAWIESDDFIGCGFHRALAQRHAGATAVSDIALGQKRWLQSELDAQLRGALSDDEHRSALARHLFLLVEGSMAAAVYEPDRPSAADLRRLARALLAAPDQLGTER